MAAGSDEAPVVQVRKLTVQAKQRKTSKKILDSIEMDFAPRSLTAVIGASGCGKTTFVRTLNRMVELTPGLTVSGQVLYLGQDIYGRSVNPVLVRRRIGMVFQRPTVFPMSVFENAAFGLRLLHESDDEIDPAVQEALTRSGLWDEVKDDLDRSAFSLSGGQQQRLCIARALAVRPKVLLMDEPTSALDPMATQRVEATMRRLKEEIVLILVTHNVGQAARVSDRVAFLHQGRLVETGPTAELLERPREVLTQEFVTGRFE
jgi:phosphate transport system ATP-binding protein